MPGAVANRSLTLCDSAAFSYVVSDPVLPGHSILCWTVRSSCAMQRLWDPCRCRSRSVTDCGLPQGQVDVSCPSAAMLDPKRSLLAVGQGHLVADSRWPRLSFQASLPQHPCDVRCWETMATSKRVAGSRKALQFLPKPRQAGSHLSRRLSGQSGCTPCPYCYGLRMISLCEQVRIAIPECFMQNDTHIPFRTSSGLNLDLRALVS